MTVYVLKLRKEDLVDTVRLYNDYNNAKKDQKKYENLGVTVDIMCTSTED